MRAKSQNNHLNYYFFMLELRKKFAK